MVFREGVMDASKQAEIEYLENISLELIQMAEKAGNQTLAYLFLMAHQEAKSSTRREPERQAV